MNNLPTWGIWNPYEVLFPEQIANENFIPLEVCINSATIFLVDQNPIMMQKQSSFSKEPQIIAINCPEGYSRFVTTSPVMPVFFARKKPIAVKNTIRTRLVNRRKNITPVFINKNQDQDQD
ncbi:MAG: hypothetical protein EBS07_12735 [Sphingobacteriia bacterium]|nr:hypothetical protein [Sphingobacteriia bacterium]